MENFLSHRERLELSKAHRKEKYRRFADRIKVIMALDSGESIGDISRILLLDPDTVRNYKKKYQSEGLEGLCSFEYRGRPPLLTNSEEKELKLELRSRIYLTTQEVIHFIEEAFEITYTKSGVISLLKRLGFSYKKPSLVPGKADAEAQQDFLTRLEALKQAKSLKDKVYYGDGTHPQHNSMPSHGWLPKGEETPLKSNTGRQRVNLNGVLDSDTLEVIVREETRFNADSTIRFFKQIERANPESEHIYIILDNAGYYKGEKIREYLRTSKIEIVYLPPYSPNLNLIERLWKFFKKQIIYNRYYEKFKDFRKACLSFFHKRNLKRFEPELRSLLTPKFQVVSA